MGAKFFHADGQTDGHDEADSRFSQFCESTWKVISPNLRTSYECRSIDHYKDHYSGRENISVGLLFY
jgi:hypothetical protein